MFYDHNAYREGFEVSILPLQEVRATTYDEIQDGPLAGLRLARLAAS